MKISRLTLKMKNKMKKLKFSTNLNKKLKRTNLKRKRYNEFPYGSLVKKLELQNYLREELESSTTHGLPYLVINRIHYFERILWAISFAVCLTLAILLLNIQFTRFIAAPTVMSVEMNYFDWNISYPAITLCPLYKPEAAMFRKIINDTNNQTGLLTEAYYWSISQAALDTLDYMDLTAPDEVMALIHPNEYAAVAASLFRKFHSSWMSTSTNVPMSVEAAMTEMGMCHVINSNVAIYDKPHQWNRTNPRYVKNNIELSVFEADFYASIINYSNIFKVFIHSPDEVTTSTTSTFTFDVEGNITFGLSVWSSGISEELRYKTVRLRKCRFLNEPIGERYPIYSYSHCILECRIKMIQKICGCVPHFYKPLKHERICYIYELQCVLDHRKEIMTLEASEETLEKFHYSKDLPRLSRDCGCLSTCELDLYYKDHEDFVPGKGLKELKIKITSFPKVRVMRDIIFNFYDILLRSGGVVNLCIGSSIISMIEFFVVLIKLVINVIFQIIEVIIVYVNKR